MLRMESNGHAASTFAAIVRLSRVALGYRNRTDLANSLEFTVRTLADIEHGVQPLFRTSNPGLTW